MKTPRQIAIENAAELALTQMEQVSKAYRNDPEWQAALTALQAALTMKEKKPKVWVLTMDIENSGISSEVFMTEASALLSLHVYVKQYWSDEIGDPIPADPIQAIEEYFARDEADDSYMLDEREVQA